MMILIEADVSAFARYRLGVGARGDHPFVSTCSSIEVIILLISLEKYHFRFKSALTFHRSRLRRSRDSRTIHIFGWGRAKKRVFASPCVWCNKVFYISLRIIKRLNICFIRVKSYGIRKHTSPVLKAVCG